ncbi:MAG: hypothetical protein NTW50_01970 [Candidatus Berkelbacteria bacterium]|nr:hypothetical protein [Candidatus Berkelbacteria bacterium]
MVILDWLTPNQYSQYEVDGLSNGTTYYFTFKSVDLKSDNSEVESAASDQVSAIPADIAARRVTAIQLSDGRVQVNYSLRYDSTVSIQYYNVDTATWVNTSSGAVSGDISEGQTGSVDLPEHTAYWLAKTDYPNQYFALTDGFKVRIKVIVPSQGNTTAYSPSQVLTLDTAPPHAAALTVDASAGTSVDLTLAAAEDPNSTIQMTISNDSGFDGGVWQDFASSVTGWDPAGSAAVYVKLKDSFSNETVLSYSYPEVIQNFILKDGSDLRIPKYTLFLTWKETSLPNFSKYIVERKAGDGSFSEVFRTTQAAYIDLNLSKDSLYSYKVKILDTEGNISQPSNILASQPGLAPDVTAAPTIQVFGYKQEIGVKAIIDWKTDQYADSFVAFSTEELTNESNIKTVSGQNAIVYGQLDRVLEHEVTITGLQPGKKYYMKVLSQNDIKITGYSDFFIVSTPAYIALEIKNLTFSDLLPTSVWVNWQTNKTSTTKLVYGMNSNFDRTLTDTGLNTDHKFKLENLTPGANYKLQITATDEDGNSVASDEYNVNPPSNPAISAITLKSIGNNAATVDWTTNVGADSSVEFGKDTSYGFASGKSDLVIQHEIQLIGLESKTLYHFRIKSRDIFGTEVMSSDQTFTTISDTTPPVVSNISTQLSQVSTPQGLVYQATISWQTDEGSTSQVEYGDSTSGQYSKKTQEDDSFNMHHVVILSDLKANSAISFRVVSKDSSQNEAISKNNTIITPPEEGSLYKIVINSLSDTFSWVTKLKDKFSKK